MLHRLRALYRRYALHHLRLTLAPGVTVARGRLVVTGPGPLVVEHGGTCTRGTAPLSLPHDPTSGLRVSQRNGVTHIPALPRPALWLRHGALWPRLLRRAVSVLPLLPRRHDPHIRALAKLRLGLDTDLPAPRLAALPVPYALRNVTSEIAILLPVHNARPHVMACLTRIVAMTDLPWRLVIVEDGSTDPDLRPALERWVSAEPRARLVCHDYPRGFAGAVNAGLETLRDFAGPVILLNSDVTLPQAWASRLIAPILAETGVASVTPLANDGELMGAPFACAPVALRNGEADAIDAQLRHAARADALPSLPTGTGFCMALSPHWLAAVPRFDERFGRGYGEEVDWCQRIRALGGRHVCQTGLFVGHLGAASFGRDQRQAMRAASAPRLSRRWPRFDGAVTQALEHDPLVTDRLRAGLLWARTRLGAKPIPLYVAHSLGGGAGCWLDQRLATHEVALVLRLGGPLRWQIELHAEGHVTRGATAAFSEIRALLDVAGPHRVIYTCAVGDPAPEQIPFRLLDLCANGQGLEMQVHDYFPLSRDYTFRSEPDPGWQALWRVALDRADRITVFSQASARIVAAVHPDLAHKISVTPHAPLGPVPKLSPAPSGRMVIGVPGDLNAHKGAEVVAHLARVFARTGEARLVVLGQVAPDCPLPRSVTVLGGYVLADLPHLVARHGIGAWLVPSLWPETFSYVTQETLATGLPVAGFDLGGQGEALCGAENGHVVSLRNEGWEAEPLLATLRGLPGWADPAPKPRLRPRFRRVAS